MSLFFSILAVIWTAAFIIIGGGYATIAIVKDDDAIGGSVWAFLSFVVWTFGIMIGSGVMQLLNIQTIWTL